MDDDDSKINEAPKELVELPHHQQHELCRTRPAYRQGRRLTAVKTYSITTESAHLLVFGVPKVNLRQELKNLASKYGKVLAITATNSYPTEEFTECFHITYEKVQFARIGKKCLDTKNFYGGSLHVCYAPELETVEETRQKLYQRKLFVQRKLIGISREKKRMNYTKQNMNNMIYNHTEIPTHSNLRNTMKIDSQNSSNSIQNLEGNVTMSKDVSAKGTIEEVDNKVYVFKKKKRKQRKNDLLINVYTSESIPTVASNDNSTEDVSKSDGMSRIIVCDNIDKPKIENIPRKTVNQIIMNINTKLI